MIYLFVTSAAPDHGNRGNQGKIFENCLVKCHITRFKTHIFHHMDGGAITILKNMSSSMGRMASHIWNGKNSCLKPPASYDIPFIMIIYKSLLNHMKNPNLLLLPKHQEMFFFSIPVIPSWQSLMIASGKHTKNIKRLGDYNWEIGKFGHLL